MTTILGLTVATITGRIIYYLGYVGTYITSGILILLGLAYVFLGIIYKNSHNPSFKGGPSNKATATSLFLMLTLSPCEAVIPVFFAASNFGWSMLLVLALFVALGTISSMLAIIYLTLAGYRRLHFTWLEENEKAAIGIILLLLGIFAILFG